VDKCSIPRLRALRFLFPNSWRSSACVVMRDVKLCEGASALWEGMTSFA
jgi:hypothetical protein